MYLPCTGLGFFFFPHFPINLAWFDYFPLKKMLMFKKTLSLELKLQIKFCTFFTLLHSEKNLGCSPTNNSVCPHVFIEY